MTTAPGGRRPPPPDGLLVIDKPADWTSHDVVARVRRLVGTRKVGHAGTLDPMATGLLVLGVERATRLLTYLVGADKDYDATIRLGVATTTDDAEGEVLTRTAARPTREALDAAVARLTGDIRQRPSSVSAIKIDGQRAYARVRAGETVDLPDRPVTVHRFDVLAVRPVEAGGTAVLDVDVSVTCSSGTYIRALARDLGADLGVGGHLTALRRTRVGPYGLEHAAPDDLGAAEDLRPRILPAAAAARVAFPARELDAAEVVAVSHGRRLRAAGEAGTTERPVAAFAPDGALVALLVDEPGGAQRPVLVLAPHRPPEPTAGVTG